MQRIVASNNKLLQIQRQEGTYECHRNNKVKRLNPPYNCSTPNIILHVFFLNVLYFSLSSLSLKKHTKRQKQAKRSTALSHIYYFVVNAHLSKLLGWIHLGPVVSHIFLGRKDNEAQIFMMYLISNVKTQDQCLDESY